MKKKHKYIVGIDEVGRGPIAGPVAVGAILMKRENLSRIRNILRGIKECKQLSERKREYWKAKIDELVDMKMCRYKVTMVSANVIDEKGISFSIQDALKRSLKHITKNISVKDTLILLDGGLKAPDSFDNQKTIIKGDEKEISIAMASIVAKVTRDQYMIKSSLKYPEYKFDIHKGYGTSLHMDIIKRIGITSEHRLTFISPDVFR